MLVSAGPLVLLVGIQNKDANPDLIVSYVFCTLLLFFGAFLCVWGGMSKPIKVIEEPVINEQVEKNIEVDVSKKESKKIKEEDVIDVEPELVEGPKAIEVKDDKMKENSN